MNPILTKETVGTFIDAIYAIAVTRQTLLLEVRLTPMIFRKN
jgi:hypothetical protein